MKWVGPNALHLHVTHIQSRSTKYSNSKQHQRRSFSDNNKSTAHSSSECTAEKLQTAVSTHSRKQYYPHLHIKWMFYRFDSLVLSASNWVIWSCMNQNTKQKPVYFAMALPASVPHSPCPSLCISQQQQKAKSTRMCVKVAFHAQLFILLANSLNTVRMTFGARERDKIKTEWNRHKETFSECFCRCLCIYASHI